MPEQGYVRAETPERMAKALIEQHHPHLTGQRIEYYYSVEPMVVKGRPVWGQARKVTGLPAFLARPDRKKDESDPFFVMLICQKTWENELKDKQREALIDHELMHFGVDDKGTLFIRNHDIEEFTEIAIRHGAWNKSQAVFYDVWKEQLAAAEGSEGNGQVYGAVAGAGQPQPATT